MAALTAERLAHFYRQLAEQPEDGAFMRRIRIYLDGLKADQQLGRILTTLKREADLITEQFNTTMQREIEAAIGLRDQLIQAAPEVDDSNQPVPDNQTQAYGRWKLASFASFDRLASQLEQQRFPLVPVPDQPDQTVIPSLLGILRLRLHLAQFGAAPGPEPTPNRRPDLDPLGQEIWNLGQQHAAALATFRQEGRTLPGAAYWRLGEFRDRLRPEPLLRRAEQSEAEQLAEAVARLTQQIGGTGIARRAVEGQPLTLAEAEVLAELVTFLRGEARRLQDELLLRVAAGEGIPTRRRLGRLVFAGSIHGGRWIAGILGGLIVVVVGAYLTGHLPGGGSSPGTSTGASTPAASTSGPPPESARGGYKSGLVSETLPDDSRLPENRRAVKTWTIQNEGSRTWTGLTLRRVTPREVSTVATVPLPTTATGERCTIRVPLRTPGAPGRVEEKWALFDAHGRRIFPPGGELTINLVIQ